jgi:hypothetical protein
LRSKLSLEKELRKENRKELKKKNKTPARSPAPACSLFPLGRVQPSSPSPAQRARARTPSLSLLSAADDMDPLVSARFFFLESEPSRTPLQRRSILDCWGFPCSPRKPSAIKASESARTILLGLNREWIGKQGDFFVESPINFLTAVIWFLRKYKVGRFCTLPHVIELMQTDYEELFPVLNSEPEIEVLVNPFISAYQNNAMEQLEGQVASAKIGMARLSSPQLYWVLSSADFTLDINNPAAPKIVCMGNNPEKQLIYGAVLSLYVSRLVRQVNKKDRLKCSLVFDEFPTLFFNHMDSLIATARSNKVATTLGIQDFSQLKKDYGRDGAEVIMNITGNIISGQVMGETARQLSERFGKILQDRESVSINRTDTSISRSRQLDFAVPAAKIASLSSGEFVGMVADDPHQKIKRKVFCGEIFQDTEKLQQEIKKYQPLPVVAAVTRQQVQDNYHQVKLDIKQLVAAEIEKLKSFRPERE